MKDISSFINNISLDEFYKSYWNKRPKLFKSAIPNAKDLATKNDLLEFASDEEFESRIIYENNSSYKVKDGPIKPEDLKGKHTVACHALNIYSEDFKELEMVVTNIAPHWQFDDIMATVSSKGASVGAHTDHYGVFIIQGHGSREWFIQENPNQEFKEDLEVKILKEFKADYSWVLEPGDMIYVPPLCAHHGITIEDSVSYSLGFKAFESENIVKDYLFDLGDSFESKNFYRHEKASEKFKLNDEFVDFFYNELQKLSNNKDLFKSWLSSTLSSPRYPSDYETDQGCDLSDFELNMDVKFIHYPNESKNNIYLNGMHFLGTDEDLKTISILIESRQIPPKLPKTLIDFLIKSQTIVLS